MPFTQVRLQDAFWRPRQEVNRQVTLPIEYQHCKATGRYDAFAWEKGRPGQPHIFWDSDVAKWIEAVAYSLADHPDPELERLVDGYVAMMERAQAPDGYLNSHYLRVDPDQRWTNLRDCHELYCAGHLIEAAVAYHAATGKRRMLDAMRRYADCIARTFGRGRGRRRGCCGHPEIELALVRLHRATGERRYLDLASYFVDERGSQPSCFAREALRRGERKSDNPAAADAYCQAHKPVREQTGPVGHAVRALYLYSGMADVAAETGDKALVQALKTIWESIVRKRLHVTGGLGQISRNEGFTFDYDLPNEEAYDETCANIALVFWAQRMLHLDADGRYADLMELTLYNSVASGVSLDGRRFFYANPLAAHPGITPHGRNLPPGGHYVRSDWFGCACCPPNIARLLASFGGYVYSQSAAGVRVNLFVQSEARLAVKGVGVTLRQKTAYPWRDTVRLEVRPATPCRFEVAIRIPGWSRETAILVNGKRTGAVKRKDYWHLTREWKAGDRVDIRFDMPIERLEANPRVRQDAGRVALRRGPVVYCLEEVDNGADLNDVILPDASKLTASFERDLLGGVAVIKGSALRRDGKAWADGALYSARRTPLVRTRIKAVPYAVWNNRAPGEMLVWIGK